MSLRDQLLKAGLVSKKDARRVNQELKKDRKESQGSKQKKKALEREARAAEEARRNAEQEARLAERRERTEARDRYEAALRVRNLILGNCVKNRGPHRFFFKGRDGRTVHRIEIQAGVAKELANGRLAIALIDHGTREEYVLVGRSAADRIAEVDPSVLVHFCPGPHAPDPSEALMEKDWEPSLGPHRV